MVELLTHKQCERVYRRAIRVPWYEYVRRFLIWRKDRMRKKFDAVAKRYDMVAKRFEKGESDAKIQD